MKNNEQHTIDIAVRQALENLEIPLKADHWELMVGKLDALNAEEAEFDKNLATKLGGVTAPYIADNWADMSSRLDALDHSETSFDALLRQRLDDVQPNMPQHHWDLMAEKIEENFSWRRKIVRYKVVEVALVLLTLFTVGNALDLPFDSVRSTDNSPSPKVETPNLKKATPTKETKSFYNPTDWRNRPATPYNNVKVEPTNGKPIVSTENLNGVDNPIAVELNNKQNSQNESYNNPTDKSGQNVESNVVVVTEIAQYTEGGVTTDMPTRAAPTWADIDMRKVLVLGKVTDGHDEDVRAIVGKALNPMDILQPSLLADTRFYDANVIYPKSKEKRAKWRLNSFVLPVADRVTANSIQYRTKTPQYQTVANLGVGIAAGYKKGKFEVEAGLSYLDKKYDLPNVEVTTGNFRTGYNKVKPQNLHLSIVSIPLSINYMAKETRRWSLYARVGAALNTIFKAEGSQFVAQTSTNSSAYIDPNSSVSTAGKVDINVFEPNVYPKGILSKDFFKNRNWLNGGLKENTYLTANAGLGLEYRLTNKVDIYVQPTFDYHFGRGIGTLNDHVHSFSVQGGVKTKLK